MPNSHGQQEAVIATGLAFSLMAGATTLGQTSELFLYSGDQSTFTVVQDGEIIREWSPASGTDRYQYAMVVRETVRTMGADAGDLGADYDLEGNDLGPRYFHHGLAARCWDGTTDGEHNYAIDTNGDVWQSGVDWKNPTKLFSVLGFGSLTYDSDGDSLWIGQFNHPTTVTEYDLSGHVIRSFETGHTKNMALAMDPADGTLWLHDRNRIGTLEQWSREGQLLATVVVPGLSSRNALGGEFRFGGGGYTCSLSGSCPGTIRVTWNNAPPQTQQGILFALNTGSYRIPSGPCQGTQLGLGTNQLRLVNTVSTGNGSGGVTGRAGSSACGGYIQLVAVGRPCETSNVAQLP